ncbi:hypothetical protein SRIMM317S_04627 [Streptomyces rimosus subsp. rimosus]
MTRGDENLTLVARGAVVTKDQQDFYRGRLPHRHEGPGGRGPERRRGGGQDSKLGSALALADDDAGRRPVQEAVETVRQWQARHAEARAADDQGDYDRALAKVIGGGAATGQPSTGWTPSWPARWTTSSDSSDRRPTTGAGR